MGRRALSGAFLALPGGLGTLEEAQRLAEFEPPDIHKWIDRDLSAS